MATPDPTAAGGDHTAKAFYRSWVSERIRNVDTDQQGHVNNAVLATYFETGRLGLFDAESSSRLGDQTNIMVVRILMEFQRELTYPGMAEIGSRVVTLGRTSLIVSQAIFKGDACIATAEATCVLVDRRSRRPTPIPAALRAHLAQL